MEQKKPWQSKTMLLNGIVGLCAFLGLFWSGAAAIGPFLQAHALESALLWSGLNMLLRYVTKDKISLGE